MYRRTALTLTALAAATLTAAATLVPAAFAATPTSPTTAQLRQERAHARSHLSQARDRARDAAADLAAARELAAMLGAEASPDASPAPAAAPVPTGAPAPSTTPAPAPGAPALPAGALPADMDVALAARLLADGAVTTDELSALQARVAATRRQVERLKVKVERLTRRIQRREQIARWARTRAWRPLIGIACEKYGVDPGGLYRMMMLESGGNPRVVGGIYNGLFQYTHSEWARHWNPWRHESIYDGWAQIRATALALSKGMGPGQWPNTYRMAF